MVVPNVPCGVESFTSRSSPSEITEFLMYRVELKEERSPFFHFFHSVPNVPCGVESIEAAGRCFILPAVPNVPCGVESSSGAVGRAK